MEAIEAEILRLTSAFPPDLLVFLGAPLREDGRLYNTAMVFHGGCRMGVARKMLLPNYGVFDERRLFSPGSTPFILEFNHLRMAVHICEDSWWPSRESFRGLPGACDLLINLSASPYCRNRETDRETMARAAVAAIGVPMLYTNLVGGQDELVFDGGALAVDADGTLRSRAPLFCEGVLDVEWAAPATPSASSAQRRLSGMIAPLPDDLEEVYSALCLGIRDYTDKNHFPGVLIALSGGIDSALVAALAVDALGPSRVMAVTLPSTVTSSETLSDALDLAARLDIPCLRIPIAPGVHALSDMLTPACASIDWTTPLPGTLMEENLQARLRGVVVMALSNRYGHLVLTTGNKSEIATGYATLYGDMCGGFAPIKDVPKTLVFALARWRNLQSEVIPPSTIERPPSAELRPGQKDTDSLPPYDLLDPLLERYVEQQARLADLLAAGVDESLARRVIRLVNRSEYKRRQGAPGIKITPKAFGRDRRMPITNAFSL